MECERCGKPMQIKFSYSSIEKGQITVWGCDQGHEYEESRSADVPFDDDINEYWRNE